MSAVRAHAAGARCVCGEAVLYASRCGVAPVVRAGCGVSEDVSMLMICVCAVRCRARWLGEHPHSSSVPAPASAGPGRWRPRRPPPCLRRVRGVCKARPRRLRSERIRCIRVALGPPARSALRLLLIRSHPGVRLGVPASGRPEGLLAGPRLGHPAQKSGSRARSPRSPPRPLRGSCSRASPAAWRGQRPHRALHTAPL